MKIGDEIKVSCIDDTWTPDAEGTDVATVTFIRGDGTACAVGIRYEEGKSPRDFCINIPAPGDAAASAPAEPESQEKPRGTSQGSETVA